MASPNATKQMTSQTLDGIFALNKPAGLSSGDVLRQLQYRFGNSVLFKEALKEQYQKSKKKRPRKHLKMGHGGTLDPMATGILVVGIGSETSMLADYLNGCSKEYIATGLLGCSTDSFDRLGKILKNTSYSHVTRSKLEETLEQFRGEILQKPPIFSALRMNGKRLYEYARSGQTLPREIVPRPITVQELELLEFTTDHNWEFPSEEAGEDTKLVAEYAIESSKKGENTNPLPRDVRERIIRGIKDAQVKESKDKTAELEPPTKKRRTSLGAEAPSVDAYSLAPRERLSDRFTSPVRKPPIFKLRITSSSGFYVRSLIHDLGEALDSSAHMVELIRTRQGNFSLDDEQRTLDFDQVQDREHPEIWQERLIRAIEAYWMDQAGKISSSNKKKGKGLKDRKVVTDVDTEAERDGEKEDDDHEYQDQGLYSGLYQKSRFLDDSRY